MRADVRDGAKFAAFAGKQTPVEVFRFEKPVLEVGALDMDDPAKASRDDVRAHLQDGRIETDVVIDGEDLLWITRRFADELGGFFRRHRERFFADDMFAGAQSRQ